jgi:hypothetical protein
VAVELHVGESVGRTGNGGHGGETARPFNKKKKQVDGIFVINGFYMSMRNTYTTPPAKIHYYTVQWPTDALAWKSFRVCFFLLLCGSPFASVLFCVFLSRCPFEGSTRAL